MILDRENMFSYKQAITVTADSTNIIDLGPPHWMGASGHDKEIPLMLAIDEVFTAAGAATLTVELKSSPVVGFGAGVKTHYARTFGKAELIRNGRLELGASLPVDVQRYVKAVYTVATGPMTAGKLTFGVTASRQTNG